MEIKVLPSYIFRYLLLVLLLFDWKLIIYSQNYTEFNFHDGIWIEEEFSKDNYQKFGQIYCNGDTIFNAQSYHKLYESIKSLDYPLWYPDTLFHQYIGAIRENESRQVLFKGLYDTAEIIIYDFNLQLGDTIWLWSQYNIVDSIDSYEVCGKVRKRFWINGQSMHESLIEGIGFSNGLLGYNHISSLIFESYYRLICYTERFNSSCAECNLILSQNNSPVLPVLFPNPVQDILKIQTNKIISSIEVLDLLGTVSRLDRNLNSTYHIVDFTKLKSGLYFVRIHFYDDSNSLSLILKY